MPRIHYAIILSLASIPSPARAGDKGFNVTVGLANGKTVKVTLVAGGPFLHNFLEHGRTGTLTSGGSIPLLNWATALEVAAANVVLYSEFLEHYVAPIFARAER